MMGADPATAAVVGRYLHAAQGIKLMRVGDGIYGLVSRWSDGTRMLEFVGFETPAHAEAYGAFQIAALGLQATPPLVAAEPDGAGGGTPTGAAVAVAEGLAAQFAHMGIVVGLVGQQCVTRCAFDVVVLNYVVPALGIEIAPPPAPPEMVADFASQAPADADDTP